jgi:dihydropyrimidinase
MAALIDQPIMIFHVSTAEGVKVTRDARGEGLKVFAETCPQYLFLTADDLDKPGMEGAKWMCSPPPRRAADQEALWQALALGDLQTVSSDHAPYRFDDTGKLRAGADATFKQIANGLPGLETRLPLLFDAMVSKGWLGLEKFVELTATAPAKIYNMHPRKGSIAFGSAIAGQCSELPSASGGTADVAGLAVGPFANDVVDDARSRHRMCQKGDR